MATTTSPNGCPRPVQRQNRLGQVCICLGCVHKSENDSFCLIPYVVFVQFLYLSIVVVSNTVRIVCIFSTVSVFEHSCSI